MVSKSSLESSLKECSKYARKGKKIADTSIVLMREKSSEILERINYTIADFEAQNINSDNATTLLLEQLEKTKTDLTILPGKLTDDIKSISKKTINITLFGRTMAGKSTLMEILTHGTGASIGKGAQRTTLDVREYAYRGMTITDVPGIAAFDGEIDSRTAFDAARKADMVLFLITDDAPQASEAECLKNILNLGKPVICLINIRANIDKNTSMKLFQRDLHKKMDDERLNELKKQFLEFGEHFGQTWDMIKFEFVHLKAAYLSQQTEWQEYSDDLFRLSRFEKIERLIAQEVIKNGCYYKIKAYIDAVVVPLTEIADTLVQQGVQNVEQCNTIIAKKKKLSKWLETFKSGGISKIDTKLNLMKSEIKREVPPFAETHYSDKQAGEKWSEHLKKYNIEKRCSDILKELADECEEKLNEIYREITAELKFSYRMFDESTITMPTIVDGKRIWGWSVTLLSSGLGIAALFGVPVVGWVALGIGVIGGLLSLLFKSKEKKIAEARHKLETRINDSLDSQFKDLNKRLNKIFVDELVKKQVEPTFALIDNIIKSLHTLSKAQQEFSESLYCKQEAINRILISEAVSYLKIDFSGSKIVRLARIAGTCIAMSTYEDFNDEDIVNLSNILNETIYVISNSRNTKEIIANTAGLDLTEISVLKDDQSNIIAVKIISKNNLDAIGISRIKLAQQISRLYIMK